MTVTLLASSIKPRTCIALMRFSSLRLTELVFFCFSDLNKRSHRAYVAGLEWPGAEQANVAPVLHDDAPRVSFGAGRSVGPELRQAC